MYVRPSKRYHTINLLEAPLLLTTTATAMVGVASIHNLRRRHCCRSLKIAQAPPAASSMGRNTAGWRQPALSSPA